ncbi:hypothetical protein DFS33DRAFT_1277137 [Desarmillaria ectypa]|nr:hypothetical protein DFS33DRAFT_1277137 [Desarmillaria ectypa]
MSRPFLIGTLCQYQTLHAAKGPAGLTRICELGTGQCRERPQRIFILQYVPTLTWELLAKSERILSPWFGRQLMSTAVEPLSETAPKGTLLEKILDFLVCQPTLPSLRHTQFQINGIPVCQYKIRGNCLDWRGESTLLLAR